MDVRRRRAALARLRAIPVPGPLATPTLEHLLDRWTMPPLRRSTLDGSIGVRMVFGTEILTQANSAARGDQCDVAVSLGGTPTLQSA